MFIDADAFPRRKSSSHELRERRRGFPARANVPRPIAYAESSARADKPRFTVRVSHAGGGGGGWGEAAFWDGNRGVEIDRG